MQTNDVDNITFANPLLAHDTIRVRTKEYNQFNSYTWRYPVSTGKLILFPLILLCGCGQYVEDRKSEDYAPIYLGIDDTQDVQASYGAIYTPNKNGLFAMESPDIPAPIIATFIYSYLKFCPTNLSRPHLIFQWYLMRFFYRKQ